ncbi:DUF1003 domain-containing protein [Pseudolabrys sp. FHR47]|uniref:DUF1003 domain-containing protein n=1 Tax=Pseudolabrys sp. FHR47 TaxID=2562284 RepID=UPI0010BEAB5E|nr:DUF1003 domain-containing protein [Pseudolabrys sp. FHR47]
MSDPSHPTGEGGTPPLSSNNASQNDASTSGVPTRAKRARPVRFQCVICNKEKPLRDVTSLDVVRPSLLDRIHAEHPDLPAEGYVCNADLDRYRSRYVAELLGQERGELTRLEHEVVESLAAHETLAENVEAEYAGQRSFGERLSDRLAAFGGSWTFIMIFFAVLVVWMAFNLIAVQRDVFDPYPFILLNLVLSCLAAIQAPIIMMSQNRQEAKDRLRSENDYRVNLKAELEIRHLHEKIDHILTRQWERLAEIQQIQLEMMQDSALRNFPRK